MVRALSLYLPWWAVQRRQRRSSSPDRSRCVLIVRTVAHRQLVVRTCALAMKAGVKPGMTLAHARALLPAHPMAHQEADEPCVHEHDPQRDRQSLARLARWATRFAPKVQPDGEDGLLMDVTGCAHLYQGEQKLITQLIQALAQLKFTALVAIAPTFGAAWALAHHGDPHRRIIDRLDQIPAALSPLPVEALRLDEETADNLREVAVRHIGQLLSIPRRLLPSRFSEDLMLRIDQALGLAMETIDPMRVPQAVIAQRSFEGPVRDAKTIALATRQLLDDFTQKLHQLESGVLSLQMTLHRYEADVVLILLSVSRPTRDARHLWQLLSPHLERANVGHGVEMLELRAISVAKVAHHQLHHPQWSTCDGAAPMNEAISEQERARLMDVLVHRLGPDHVTQLEPMESHLPERAARLVPVDHPPLTSPARITSHDRPTQLFDSPEPIAVHALTPDGPVSLVQWRGQSLRVESCRGPERLTSQWWREPTGSRDYFAVRLHTGLHLWLFRDARSCRWFAHGWWA